MTKSASMLSPLLSWTTCSLTTLSSRSPRLTAFPTVTLIFSLSRISRMLAWNFSENLSAASFSLAETRVMSAPGYRSRISPVIRAYSGGWGRWGRVIHVKKVDRKIWAIMERILTFGIRPPPPTAKSWKRPWPASSIPTGPPPTTTIFAAFAICWPISLYSPSKPSMVV